MTPYNNTVELYNKF